MQVLGHKPRGLVLMDKETTPLRIHLNFGGFSYLKYIYRSIFPFAYERKKLLPLNILAEYKFVMLFKIIFIR